jgi:hypothetical protein
MRVLLSALCVSAGLMGLAPAAAAGPLPGTGVPAASVPVEQAAYIWRGRPYPYRWRGRYYLYRWNGGYYNHRRWAHRRWYYY